MVNLRCLVQFIQFIKLEINLKNAGFKTNFHVSRTDNMEMFEWRIKCVQTGWNGC